MKAVKKCGLAVLLFTLFFVGCAGTAETSASESELPLVDPAESTVEEDVAHTELVGEETLTSILDRDGSDGYTGDLVLVYHPRLEGGTNPMGNLDELVETTENRIPTREDTYLQTSTYHGEDPYLTDAVRQADPCYDLENGDLWQIGFQRIFYMGYGLPEEMLFQVSAVGERCRVWSPVNPAYGLLEGIDPTYPEQLVREMDEAIPVLEQTFGPIPDVRGDGKMNILCFDFSSPISLGKTRYADIYGEILINGQTERGNHLPVAYINTAPLIQKTYSKLSDVYTVVIHEMAHTIFAAQQNVENGSVTMTSSKNLLAEFLAVTAQEVVYPGSSIQHFLPWWYSDKTVWADLLADDADVYLRDQSGIRQNGKSIFRYSGDREDYAAVFLLACFAENRGSRELLMNITDYIDVNNRTIDIWEGLWKGLGYEDYPSFIEDFLLSILLHEEEGPYQLHPFEGYEPTLWNGEENPFSHMKPIITDEGIYIGAGSYAILRPVDGVYYPPATASKDLCYVGISWKSDVSKETNGNP